MACQGVGRLPFTALKLIFVCGDDMTCSVKDVLMMIWTVNEMMVTLAYLAGDLVEISAIQVDPEGDDDCIAHLEVGAWDDRHGAVIAAVG